jgi:hypothetical protein
MRTDAGDGDIQREAVKLIGVFLQLQRKHTSIYLYVRRTRFKCGLKSFLNVSFVTLCRRWTECGACLMNLKLYQYFCL